MRCAYNLKSSSPSYFSGRIAIAFLITGILSIMFSISYELQVLAFVGLGLTFWGALFALSSPKKIVESRVSTSGLISFYSTIDRIVKDLGGEKAYYISPYPKDVYLPEHLRGLKDIVVFIPSNKDATFPSIEEVAQGKFITKKPKGLLISPPGIGQFNQIETKVDFAKITLPELCEVLPHIFLENFDVAKKIVMINEENQVNMTVSDSITGSLYSAETNLKSVAFLGSPIASAVACAIAKSTGKTVTIDRYRRSVDGSKIQIFYQIM